MISIHPMLRFNEDNTTYFTDPGLFQYILCYGSTVAGYWECIRRDIISIHPMLRFNAPILTPYNLLENISIHPMLRFNII